ncbi:hypothetical protein ZBT109_1542 [Zymobacter palmae]|uniref:Uncharacterized protein n=1 Tax=Zymobacter palmae TaxID=33074 RepID=A0A348HF97_9GAMM|nr:hypothetical protein ZBT109_1542 [Zymobacter palmae]
MKRQIDSNNTTQIAGIIIADNEDVSIETFPL